MPKIAVLDDYDKTISRLPCWKTLPPDCTIDFLPHPVGGREVADYDVIVTVRERTRITREFLAHAKQLKHLALTGRLSGQADLAALQERHISVSYTAGSGSSAAELTIALILGITKGISERDHVVRSGGWHAGLATTLSGKTLGILGLGRIGTTVAQFGSLMGMRVISWGPTPDQGRAIQYGLTRLPIEQVLQTADVIAICLRLSEKTRDLIGAKDLALMKEGASLVNTARAEIVDKHALYAILREGRIRGAFDVFYEEPLPHDDLLRTLPNVLLSPHMGYVTHEVYQTFFSQVVHNILAWKDGRPFNDALA